MLKIKNKGIQIANGKVSTIPSSEMDIFIAFISAKYIKDEKALEDIVTTYNIICEKHSKKQYGL